MYNNYNYNSPNRKDQNAHQHPDDEHQELFDQFFDHLLKDKDKMEKLLQALLQNLGLMRMRDFKEQQKSMEAEFEEMERKLNAEIEELKEDIEERKLQRGLDREELEREQRESQNLRIQVAGLTATHGEIAKNAGVELDQFIKEQYSFIDAAMKNLAKDLCLLAAIKDKKQRVLIKLQTIRMICDHYMQNPSEATTSVLTVDAMLDELQAYWNILDPIDRENKKIKDRLTIIDHLFNELNEKAVAENIEYFREWTLEEKDFELIPGPVDDQYQMILIVPGMRSKKDIILDPKIGRLPEKKSNEDSQIEKDDSI